MTVSGRLLDTYVAALQHDLVSIPDDAIRIGVVRRPTQWLHPYVDENLSALGPPPSLLDEFQTRHDELTEAGLADAAAHDRAWRDVEYDRRYLEHLDTDPKARAALARVREWRRDGRDVVLVCYENTDDKRCHRTLLRDCLDRDPGEG